MLDEGIPVKRDAELLLEKLYRRIYLVNAELLGRGIIVHKRRGERMHGLLAVVGQGAPHRGVIHHVRVAGVVRRQPAVADIGILVLDGDTDLNKRQRAHIAGDAAGDGLIDIVAAELLAHERKHERRVLLHVYRIIAWEAEDYVLGQSVVKCNGNVRPLGLAEPAVGSQALPQGVGRVGDHAVECIQVCSERLASVSLDPLIDHHGSGKICRQPAVFPKRLCDAYGIVHDEYRHLDPCAQPFVKCKRRVLDSAPLAAGIEVRALNISLANVMAGLVAFEEVLKGAVLLFDAYFSFPHSCSPPQLA